MPMSAVRYALLQDVAAPSEGLSAIAWIIIVALIILVIAGMWRVFEKAGQAGWAAIIPIYNLIVTLRIAGKPLWWIILFLIPIVNIIVWFLMYLGLARNFGKGVGYALGLLFLGPIFFPILGFGDAQYQPVAQAV